MNSIFHYHQTTTGVLPRWPLAKWNFKCKHLKRGKCGNKEHHLDFGHDERQRKVVRNPKKGWLNRVLMLRVSYKNSTICRMSWYRWIQNLYESYVLVGYHNLQSMLYLIYFCLKDILKFLHQKIFPRRWKVKTKIFSTMSCNVEGTSFKLLEKGLSTYFFSHLELIKSFSSLANCMKVLNG